MGGEELFDLIRISQENRVCVSVGGGFETTLPHIAWGSLLQLMYFVFHLMIVI